VSSVIPRNEFTVGDSDAEILDALISEGARFDLILTDPPYNLNKDFGNSSDSLELPDFLRLNGERINKCARLLTSNGSIVWFAIHHYVGFLQVMMYEAQLHYRRMNIWHYENGFSRSQRTLRNEYEPFLWFSKSKSDWHFNADDIRTPYKSIARLKTPVYYRDGNGKKVPWIPNPLGAMHGDVWEFPTLAGKRFQEERTGHPTQKPEGLILGLLKAFCPKDASGKYVGRILDPYAGSGTLGICCEKLNREGHKIEWGSIELEEKWVAVARSRLASLRTALV
jgi:site-specific DNA-methyltransferase (adenine-specific)